MNCTRNDLVKCVVQSRVAIQVRFTVSFGCWIAPLNHLLWTALILSGEGQIMELLNRHPDCICCELGISHNVFTELIYELWELGYGNSNMFCLRSSWESSCICQLWGWQLGMLGSISSGQMRLYYSKWNCSMEAILIIIYCTLHL